MLRELRRRMKIIKTCNLYLCLFTLGTAYSLTGPCLLDLQHMVHTDTRHMAMIYTARSSGYLVGAIIGGVLLDLVRSKQVVLMVCTLFVTITMFAIPWCRNIEILTAFMCINGLSLGAIETGGNVICLELWGKDSNPIFQGLRFTFGLGGLISPLIAAPFLENFEEPSHNRDNSTYFQEVVLNSTANVSSYEANITHTSQGILKIIYPFSITGTIALLVTALYLGACLISPTEEKTPKDASKIDNSERSFLFMFSITSITFCIFFIILGLEIGFAQTLTAFAVKGKLHLTAKQGSYITSAFWGAFTLSRLASVFLSMKISSLKLLIGDFCLVAVSALMLLFLTSNEWALWLASVIFGIGIAPAYAALVGWVNNHINITNRFSAIFTVGCASGEIIIPLILTYFIDTIPELFSFVAVASVVCTMVLLFILYYVFKNGSKVVESNHIKCYVVDVIKTKN